VPATSFVRWREKIEAIVAHTIDGGPALLFNFHRFFSVA
jgi:hypothetical protein